MTLFSLKNAIVAVVSTSLWLGTSLAANAMYTITDLGTLPGGSYSRPFQLSDTGQIVGASTTGSDPSGTRTAFSYKNGVMTSLADVFGQASTAVGVNSNGDIVGFHEIAGFDRGVIYRNGVTTEIGTFGGGNSSIDGINDSGLAVGYAETSDVLNGFNTPHALTYDNGVVTDLNTSLPANSNWELSYAERVNNAGQITGYGYHNGVETAYLYDHGALTDIGALISDNIGSSSGSGINANGDVVGDVSKFDGNYHGFIYKNGVITDLPPVSGYSQELAGSINNADQIVGTAYDSFFSSSHAFISDNGATTDLNSLIGGGSGWDLSAATGINNLGQIVGYGTHNGETHAFLLDPKAAVPEPSSTMLLLIGGTTLFVFARKKRHAA